MNKDEQIDNELNNNAGDLQDVADAADAHPDAEMTKEDLVDSLGQLREAHDKLMSFAQRAQADLVNYRRRAGQELEKERIRERQRMGLRYAEIVDQLEAALTMQNGADGDERLAVWLKGVRAVYDNFVSLLENEGFTRFDTVGERFDPTRHEAIGEVNVANGIPGTIAAQLRSGCTYKGEVIRPALVQTVAESEAGGTSNVANGT
jgi:molecular chaperone GrpE